MAATSFLLIWSFLFVLLEGARMKYLDDLIASQAKIEMESLMGEYCVPLWDDYKILALDTDTSGENIKTDFWTNQIFQLDKKRATAKTDDFFVTKLEKVDFTELETLANADGISLERKLSLFAKLNSPFSVYGRWKKVEEQLHESQCVNPNVEAKISAGSQIVQQKIEEDSSQSRQTGKGSATNRQLRESPSRKNENLLGKMEQIRKKGILNLVISGSEDLSDKSIELSDSLMNRQRIRTSKKGLYRSGAEDAFLATEHYLTYLNSYGKKEQKVDRDGVLSYEAEYIVGGKASDVENLKVVCYELLAIREALNMSYLATSPQKQKECLTLATALAGGGMLPQLIEPIKISIMASWAFGESILDLRSILSGEKVPIVKDEETWTSSLSGLIGNVLGGQKAKKQSEGLLYKDYLRFLILAKSTKVRAYRALDIIEKNIRLLPDYADYRIDAAVISVTGNFTYRYKNVFFGFVSIGKARNLKHQKSISVQYSYQTAGSA